MNPEHRVGLKVLRLEDGIDIDTAQESAYTNIWWQVNWNIPFVLG
jgi:hypothetical protein